jgi:hypothetical protein
VVAEVARKKLATPKSLSSSSTRGRREVACGGGLCCNGDNDDDDATSEGQLLDLHPLLLVPLTSFVEL